jgi:hypothetical protein
MKKQLQKLILFACAFFATYNANAQAPTWSWATDTVLAAGDMITDAAGNLYVSNGFGTDFLVKLDNNGNKLWAKPATGSFDSPPAVQTYPNSIALDPSGNIFVSGLFTSATMTLGTTNFTRVSTVDMFVAKFDMNGVFIWGQTLPIENVGNTGYNIACDLLGNVIAVGSYSAASLTVGTTTYTNPCTSGGGCPSMLVVKYDGSGNIVWSKSSFSGIGTSYCYSVVTDVTNNIYVGGDFLSTRNGIVKYNTLGDTVWTRPNGGWYLDMDNSGNLYSGWNKSPSPSDAIVKRYNANTGAIIWASAPTGNTSNKGIAVTHDGAGNIYFAGSFRNTAITFGSYTLNHTGGADDDIFIVKYDNTGAVLWAKSVGGTSWDAMKGFATDLAGNIFAGGYFLSPSLTFDATTLNVITALGYNIFFAKIGAGPLSVNNMSADNNVSVYPNPANGILTVTGITGKTDIKLFDVVGNIVISTSTSSGMSAEENTTLNTNELSQGIYMLVTENANGRTLTKVVVGH